MNKENIKFLIKDEDYTLHINSLDENNHYFLYELDVSVPEERRIFEERLAKVLKDTEDAIYEQYKKAGLINDDVDGK